MNLFIISFQENLGFFRCVFVIYGIYNELSLYLELIQL